MTEQELAQIQAALDAARDAANASEEATEHADKAATILAGLLEGTEPPIEPPIEPEPGGPDLSRGLLYSLPAPTTSPVDLPTGTLRGVQFAALVVKLAGTGKHQKFTGAASSQSAGQGAFGIGVNPAGKIDTWRVGGGAFNQVSNPPEMPLRQAVPIFWHAVEGSHWVEIAGVRSTSQALPAPLAEADLLAAVAAGYWGEKRVDPINGEIRKAEFWSRPLTEVELDIWFEKQGDLIDTEPDPGPVEPPVEPPPNGGGGGPIEPVDHGAHQVAITVDPAPRQSWVGMGWGCNSAIGGANSPAAVVLPRLKPHIRKVMEDIGATVIRIFTPEGADQYMRYYKPYWDLAREHGALDVFASCYMFTASPDRTPAQVAEGVAKYKAAGVRVTALSLQNEPDGNPNNAITGGHGAYVGYLRAMREELNRRGCQDTKVLGFEWRHPTGGQWNSNGAGEIEFDTIASLVPSHVYGGCLHIYDKGPGPNLYDERWMKKGAPLWSTETGNNGSPSAQARFIGGLNNGCEVEILHYVMIATPSPNNEQLGQSFLDWNGQPRPWWAGYGVIGRNLERGATFRLCRSNDRPPGMPAGQAERMAILAPRQPRALVAAAKTKGGKWQVVAVNSTHGGDASSIHAGGHYGALRQQITVSLPDKLDGTFHGHRAGQQGGTVAAKVAMSAGVMRFTVQPGETLGMTQG